MPSGRAPRISSIVPGFHREILEERRLVNVIALLVPLINLAGARRDFVPLRILLGEVAIEPAENFRRERGLHRVADFRQRRPEIAQENVLAVFVLAERFVRQVEIDAAGERKGDDQRRRHEEVRLDVLMHARFEIAVAGKDRGRDEIVFVDRLLDLRMERPGVADAGRATVTDDVEAELIEIRLQSGLVRVIGDDARARRERSLHRRIDASGRARPLSSRANRRRASRSDCSCSCNS